MYTRNGISKNSLRTILEAIFRINKNFLTNLIHFFYSAIPLLNRNDFSTIPIHSYQFYKKV